MKDSLNTLFQQRFQGHETPVDAGVWQGIQQQMAASGAPAEDGVSKLFKERFQGHESMVDPSAWANISGQLGHTAVTGTISSGFWGWAAAGVAVVGITAGALLWPTEQSVQAETKTVVDQKLVAAVPDGRTMEHPATMEASIPENNVPPAVGSNGAGEVVIINGVVSHGTSSRRTGSAQSTSGTVPKSPARQPEPPRAEEAPPTLVKPATVVTDIIANLTEQVVQQPITARPEPRLAGSKQVDQKAGNDHSGDRDPISDPVEPEESAPLPKLFMPNTFTPNGDLVNDTYTIGSEGFESAMVRVYSMKSDRLVFSTNTGEPWTGAGCEDGMYMVAVEARLTDGRTATEGKVVWLNRNPIN